MYYFFISNNFSIDLADYINSLNLKQADIPVNFLSSYESSVLYNYPLSEKNSNNRRCFYFVWGAKSYKDSKTIYGVTIYDNGYKERLE